MTNLREIGKVTTTDGTRIIYMLPTGQDETVTYPDVPTDELPLAAERVRRLGQDYPYSPTEIHESDGEYTVVIRMQEEGVLPVPATLTVFMQELEMEADYIIVTYSFNGILNGLDLDTRTKIVSPVVTDVIGWNHETPQLPWLDWGGDNTGDGVESAIIYAKAINDAHPGQDIDVELRCFWYSYRFDGNASINIVAYTGGTMSVVDYGFVNTGGEVSGSLSLSVNVTAQGSFDQPGDLVGAFRYNKETQVFQWL
jgi:hypothetical protein